MEVSPGLGRPRSNSSSSGIKLVPGNEVKAGGALPSETDTVGHKGVTSKGALERLDSPHTLGTSFADRESLMDLLDDVYSETASMSGYSAYSAKRDDNEPVNYYIRLVKFYQRYNPEKLSRVEEFLAAYKGEEEQLFNILSEKYGPEPDPPTPAERDELASDYGSGKPSVLSKAGQARTLVPKVVSAQDGHTNNPTPFWPGSKAVSDTDLLELLLSGKTENKHLQPCYMGEVNSHPSEAKNGLAYMTSEPLPDGLFLGHLWSGSLANNKALVYCGTTVDRCVLHCSEECRTTPGNEHDRWRLTMYRKHVDVGSSSQVLYRTVWDCIVQGVVEENPQTPDSSAPKKEGFFSFGFSRRRPPPPPQPPQPVAVPTSKASSGSDHSDPPVAPFRQPHQPQATSAVDTFVAHIQALEKRISDRLDSFEKRLESLETDVKGLKGASGASD